jgi:cholesterol transport system auxiliary component
MSVQRILLPVLVLGLSACSSLMQRRVPPTDVYALTEATTTPEPSTHVDVLLVARPRVRAGLDSDHLTVSLPDGRSDVYAGARWAAPLPQLIEGLLIDGLRRRGVERAVVSDRSAFRGRYLLQTDVVDFTADYTTPGAPPTVHVTVRGELGTSQDRQLLATVEGRGAATASADRRREVVAAYQAAWDGAMTDLSDQLKAALDRATVP